MKGSKYFPMETDIYLIGKEKQGLSSINQVFEIQLNHLHQ